MAGVVSAYLLPALIFLFVIPVASLHAADITLMEPGDYQVYQRNSPLKGDVRENDGKGVHFRGRGLVAHSAKWAEKVVPWLEMQLKADVK